MQEMDEQIQAVLAELEALEATFEVRSTPTYTQKQHMTDKQVKLWSIPRTTGKLLYDLVLKHQPHTILELGTSAGYSTLWLAAAARTYGGHVYTIDSSEMKLAMANEYFKRAGLAQQITTLHGAIADVIATWTKPIDCLFFDADKKNTLTYFKTLEPHLSTHACVVADDVIDIRHAMQDFITYMNEHPHYSTTEIEIDHGVLVATPRHTTATEAEPRATLGGI